jgi:hypothetical protein
LAELNQTRLKEVLHYDEDTGIFTWKISRSSFVKMGDKIKSLDKDGYFLVQIDKKSYRVHRLVWLWYYNKFPDKVIDHIDGDVTNNKINNLREATVSQNAMNRGKTIYNKSGYKGVCFHKRDKIWQSQIEFQQNGKRFTKYLGGYKTPELAHEAYCIAAKKYHAEFCNYG